MPPLVDHTDDQEQRSRAQTVVDHLQDAALDALRVQCKQTQHDKPQVADRGISHQLLHILLGIRDRRAVEDADYRQSCHPGRQLYRSVREKRQVEAQKAVSAHFQQDARQDHRTGGWRFNVRIRQPGMQRPHRHFDGKGGRESQEEPDLQVARDAAFGKQLRHLEVPW